MRSLETCLNNYKPCGSCGKIHNQLTRTVLWFLSFLNKFGEGAPPAGNTRLYQAERTILQSQHSFSARIINSASVQLSSVQLLSRVRLCDPMDCSTPGFSVHHQLQELTQTHVRGVGDAIQLCHPLFSLLLPSIFPSIRVFSNESVLCIRWPKYWSFSFSISPSNEYSGLISFRMDLLDLLAVWGTLKSFLQHHNSKASILQRSALFIVQLSHPYMTTGKTKALTRQTFAGKVMSLLFTKLSRLVITFHPRSKRLLISWLQSPSVVILETPPQNKIFHCFHCFPIYLPWCDGTECHDLRFAVVYRWDWMPWS